jgi:hypothetical protein
MHKMANLEEKSASLIKKITAVQMAIFLSYALQQTIWRILLCLSKKRGIKFLAMAGV